MVKIGRVLEETHLNCHELLLLHRPMYVGAEQEVDKYRVFVLSVSLLEKDEANLNDDFLAKIL